MISAPMTPGIHPAAVRISTMSIEPHPRSMTASGGKMIERMTLKSDMCDILIIVKMIFEAMRPLVGTVEASWHIGLHGII